MTTRDGANELPVILMAEKQKKRTTARRRRSSNRDGVVLLIVALVVAALTLGGATLLTLMQTERAATQTRGYDALVRSVDRSAVAFLVGTLETSPEEREKIGGVYDNPDYFCAAPLLTLEDAERKRRDLLFYRRNSKRTKSKAFDTGSSTSRRG